MTHSKGARCALPRLGKSLTQRLTRAPGSSCRAAGFVRTWAPQHLQILFSQLSPPVPPCLPLPRPACLALVLHKSMLPGIAPAELAFVGTASVGTVFVGTAFIGIMFVGTVFVGTALAGSVPAVPQPLPSQPGRGAAPWHGEDNPSSQDKLLPFPLAPARPLHPLPLHHLLGGECQAGRRLRPAACVGRGGGGGRDGDNAAAAAIGCQGGGWWPLALSLCQALARGHGLGALAQGEGWWLGVCAGQAPNVQMKSEIVAALPRAPPPPCPAPAPEGSPGSARHGVLGFFVPLSCPCLLLLGCSRSVPVGEGLVSAGRGRAGR